jgi:DnaJ-class molecular chaperone
MALCHKKKMSSPYETLGVDPSASDQDVKRAYRALSLKYHPDRNASPEAANKMREINEAYDVLGDSQKRRQFDMQRRMPSSFPFPRGVPPGMVEVDLNGAGAGDIFQMLFPGMFQGGPEMAFFHMDPHGGFMQQQPSPQSMMRPPAIQQHLTLTLEQAYVGCTLPIEVERWIMHGHVKVKEVETIYVDIPAGIDESEILTLVDKGNVLHDTCKGVVKVNIHVDNTTAFRRQGLDLIFCKTLTLKEALCGFSFEVKHLNGKTLAMNNTQNVTLIRPNFQKVVAGYGMTRDKNVGSLIIEFDVQFPDALTPEQVATLRDIL